MGTVAIVGGALAIVFSFLLLSLVISTIHRNRAERLRERNYFRRLDSHDGK
jgi:hypothetical protein